MSSGGASARVDPRRVHDPSDRLGHRLPQLVFGRALPRRCCRSRDRAPRRSPPAPCRRERRPDRDLELLGRLLPDRHPVPVANVLADRGVEVVASRVAPSDPHHAAHRDDRHLGAAAADVDDRGCRPARGREARHRSPRRAAPPRASPAGPRRRSPPPRSRASPPRELSDGTQIRTRGRGSASTIRTLRPPSSSIRWVDRRTRSIGALRGADAPRSTLPGRRRSSARPRRRSRARPGAAVKATTVGWSKHDAVTLTVDERVRGAEVDREISPHSGPHHPVGVAARERLLLPDRHVVLQPLDRVAARLERLGAVGRRHRDRRRSPRRRRARRCGAGGRPCGPATASNSSSAISWSRATASSSHAS